MLIYLYNNASPPNKINKSIALISTLTGTLRGETNVVRPIIRIQAANFPSFNYANIPDFGRYYYLMDVKQVRADIWDIYLKSDPLNSFNLGSVAGIVTEAQAQGTPYLENRNLVRLVKSKTDIITFPNGLLNTGEYILITAGGGS